MKAMFNDCNELKSLDLSNFNTIKVIKMNKMFENCFELEYLDLSNFNISNVDDMSFMFSKCYKLNEIKGINDFNLDKVLNKEEMFSECPYDSKIVVAKAPPPPLNNNKKLITVYFTSSSQDILNFPLSSYNTDTFSTLEEKLYNEKPELKHLNVYFLSGGRKLESSLTLEQNKIKDKDTILIYENE